MKQNYCLQLWLPPCPSFEDGQNKGKHTETIYFSGTDIYIVIFSIKNPKSFEKVAGFLKAIKEFKDTNPNILEKDIPILMVGNNAEVRATAKPQDPEIVPAKDAVYLAKQFQVSKYIEINSSNTYHIAELFNQAIGTVELLHETMCNKEKAKPKPVPLEEWQIRSLKEDLYFRSILTLGVVSGFFNQLNRTFEIEKEPGVEYFYTLDGTDPSKVNGSHYESPIKFKKPYPKAIKIIGLRRGYFPCEVQAFEVPEDSDVPDCFFDTFTKGFHILRKPNSTYFVSFDSEKEPGPDAMIYEDPGIYFDQTEKPNACFGETIEIPELIRVVAVEEGKFKSKTKVFRSFQVLPQPTVHFSPSDNMLKIETVPGIVYKYTVDGTTPTYDSQTYSGPVMLSNAKKPDFAIKVAAFPKYFFPSKVVTVIPPASNKKLPTAPATATGANRQSARSPSPTQGSKDASQAPLSANSKNRPASSTTQSKMPVKMTKAAVLQQRSSSPQTKSPTPRRNDSPRKILPFTPKSQSNSLTSSTSGAVSGRTESPTAPVVRPQKNIKSALTLKEQEAAIHRKTNVKPTNASSSFLKKSPKSKKSAQFKVNTAFPEDEENKETQENEQDSSQDQDSSVEQTENDNSQLQQSTENEEPNNSQPAAAQQTQPAAANKKKNDVSVVCKAEGTNVKFDFEKRVILTRIFIKTPGNGKGPAGYECFAVDEEEANVESIGKGELKDVEGEQIVKINSQVCCNKLLCEFKMRDGQKSFKIIDMRVEAKPHV